MDGSTNYPLPAEDKFRHGRTAQRRESVPTPYRPKAAKRLSQGSPPRSPHTPRSAKRLSLTWKAPDKSHEASPLKLTHPSLNHAILAEKIPATELEKLNRYLEWVDTQLKDQQSGQCHLECFLQIGDAMKNCLGDVMHGWDAISNGIRERLHNKPKGPNTFSNRAQALDYYLWSTISAAKVAAYLALFFTKHPALTSVALASTTAIAVPAFVHGVVMYREALRNFLNSRNEAAAVLKHAAGALRFVTSKPGRIRVADAKNYRAFHAACNKIPALSKSAVMDHRRINTFSLRDCLVLPCTVATSIMAQNAVISNGPLNQRSNLMIASGVSFILQGVLDIAQGWFAETPRALEKVTASEKRVAMARDRDLEAGKLQPANQTYLSHQGRVKARNTREAHGGRLRSVKGVCNLIVGTASVVNGGLQKSAQDTGITSSVIGTAAAFISMLYMVLTATKMFLRGNSANSDKYRQRQAQMLIAKYPLSKLSAAIDKNQTLTLDVPKGVLDRDSKFTLVPVSVRVRDNEYLGLHLAAVAIAELIEAGDPCDDHEVIRCLRSVWGMSELDLQSMLLIAQSTAPVRRLSFLKECLAQTFGTEFHFQDKERKIERPIKASMIVQMTLDLVEKNEWRKFNSKTVSHHFPVVQKKLINRVGIEQFIFAVEKVSHERTAPIGADNQSFIFVKAFAKLAKEWRRDQLQAIVEMGKKDRRELLALGLKPEDVRSFCKLVGLYAKGEIYDADSASQAALNKERKDALSELQGHPVTESLFGNPMVIDQISCSDCVRALLTQLDRRVARDDGRDSDSESIIDVTTSDSDASSSEPTAEDNDKSRRPSTDGELRINIGNASAMDPERKAILRKKTRRQQEVEAHVPTDRSRWINDADTTAHNDAY